MCILKKCADYDFLKAILSDERLVQIENVLSAYKARRIDFEEPRDENGEYAFVGETELEILDPTYVEQGIEISVLRWYEAHITTEQLLEDLGCF